MYCTKCGARLEEDDLFCTNCGTKKENIEEKEIISQNNNTNQNIKPPIETPEEKKKADILCIISLVLFFTPSILGIVSYLPSLYETSLYNDSISILEVLSPISNLAAIVLMIIARVKYPKNKFAKILMWIYIVLVVLSLLAIVFFVIACYLTCNGLY